MTALDYGREWHEEIDVLELEGVLAATNGRLEAADVPFAPGLPIVAALPDPTVTLSEFAARRDENAHEPLVVAGQGTIVAAASLTLFAGKASDGKTTWAIDFSLHAAAGLDYVGLTFPQPLNVLWIENEGPREAFRAKIEARLSTWEHAAPRIWDEPANWGAVKVSAEEARRRLRETIELHKIDVVLSDSLTRFGMSGNGTPEETRQFVEWLVEMGLSRDVAFWLLHHPRTRSEPGEDELDRISGAWQPHLDALLTLKKLGGDRARLGFVKTRWALSERPASILEFHPETQTFSYLADEADADERDLAAELVEALADGDWRTVSALRQPRSKGGVGAREDAIRDALGDPRFEQAQGDEIGRRQGATYYRITEAPRASVGVVGHSLLEADEEEAPRTTTRKGGGRRGGSSDSWADGERSPA